NSNSRKKSNKDSRYKARDERGPRKSNSHSPLRRKSSSPSRGSGPRRGKRPVASFDPSLFMKKVEEQTAAQAYIPKNMFSDFSLEKQLQDNIERKGYVTPTPIQDQAIVHILEGHDVIGTANTGTGKTAAFL